MCCSAVVYEVGSWQRRPLCAQGLFVSVCLCSVCLSLRICIFSRPSSLHTWPLSLLRYISSSELMHCYMSISGIELHSPSVFVRLFGLPVRIVGKPLQEESSSLCLASFFSSKNHLLRKPIDLKRAHVVYFHVSDRARDLPPATYLLLLLFFHFIRSVKVTPCGETEVLHHIVFTWSIQKQLIIRTPFKCIKAGTLIMGHCKPGHSIVNLSSIYVLFFVV